MTLLWCLLALAAGLALGALAGWRLTVASYTMHALIAEGRHHDEEDR